MLLRFDSALQSGAASGLTTGADDFSLPAESPSAETQHDIAKPPHLKTPLDRHPMARRSLGPKVAAGAVFAALVLSGAHVYARQEGESATAIDYYRGEVPTFVQGTRVYFVPADYAGEFQNQFDFHRQLEDAQFWNRLGNPFYLVVFQSVGGPVHGFNRTTDAAEDTWQAWQKAAGFDPKRGSLLAFSVQERDGFAIAGTNWQNGLGMKDTKLKGIYDESFLAFAKQGELVRGVLSLFNRLNRIYADGVDQNQRALKDLVDRVQSYLEFHQDHLKHLQTEPVQSALHGATKVSGQDELESLAQAAKLLKDVFEKLEGSLTTFQAMEKRIEENIALASKLLKDPPPGVLPSDLDALRKSLKRVQGEFEKGNVDSYPLLNQVLGNALTPVQEAADREELRLADVEHARGALEVAIHHGENLLKNSFTDLKNPPDLKSLAQALASAREVLENGDVVAHNTAKENLDVLLKPLDQSLREAEAARHELAHAETVLAGWKRGGERLVQTIREQNGAIDLKPLSLAIEQATLAAYSDDVKKVADAKEALSQEINKADRAFNASKKEVEDQKLNEMLIAFGVSAVALLLLMELSFRRARFKNAKSKTIKNLKKFLDQLDAALEKLDAMFAKYEAKRDWLSGAYIKGDKTTKIFENIRPTISNLYSNLKALRESVASAQAYAEYARRQKTLTAAAESWKPTTFAPDLREGIPTLFAIEEDSSLVEPELFLGSLGASLEEALRVGNKFLDAMETSRIPAKDLLAQSAQKLKSTQDELGAKGISQDWIKNHPLLKEAIDVELDLLRESDPLAYQKRLDEIMAQHRELMQLALELTENFDAVQKARVEFFSAKEKFNIDYSATVVDKDSDPRVAQEQALEELEQFAAVVSKPTSIGNVNIEREEAVKAFERATFLQKDLAKAIQSAPGEVEENLDNLDATRRRMTELNVKLTAIRENNSEVMLQTGIQAMGEVQQMLARVAKKIDAAKEALKANNHLRALNISSEAEEVLSDISKKIDAVWDNFNVLERLRGLFDASKGSMPGFRKGAASELPAGYDADKILAEGDAMWARYQVGADKDWRAECDRLDKIAEIWDKASAAAVADFQVKEAAKARAAAAKRRAAQARAREADAGLNFAVGLVVGSVSSPSRSIFSGGGGGGGGNRAPSAPAPSAPSRHTRSGGAGGGW